MALSRTHLVLIVLSALFMAVGAYTMSWVTYRNQVNTQQMEPIRLPKSALSAKVNHQTRPIVMDVPEKTPAPTPPSSLDVLLEVMEETPAQTTGPRYQQNASALPATPGKARIAIVIDDVGVVHEPSVQSLTLPPAVTLSFLPYGETSLELAHQAKGMGHEIMVHLPMEPLPRDEHPVDPGPNALFTTDTNEAIAAKIATNLQDYLPLAVGVNNHMGSRFTSWQKGMEVVLQALEENELMFLDSITSAKSKVRAAAHGITTPVLYRDVFIDHYQDSAKINEALTRLEELAREHGQAIGIGHPYPETTRAIKMWAPTLAAKNIELVPITKVIKR